MSRRRIHLLAYFSMSAAAASARAVGTGRTPRFPPALTRSARSRTVQGQDLVLAEGLGQERECRVGEIHGRVGVLLHQRCRRIELGRSAQVEHPDSARPDEVGQKPRTDLRRGEEVHRLRDHRARGGETSGEAVEARRHLPVRGVPGVEVGHQAARCRRARFSSPPVAVAQLLSPGPGGGGNEPEPSPEVADPAPERPLRHGPLERVSHHGRQRLALRSCPRLEGVAQVVVDPDRDCRTHVHSVAQAKPSPRPPPLSLLPLSPPASPALPRAWRPGPSISLRPPAVSVRRLRLSPATMPTRLPCARARASRAWRRQASQSGAAALVSRAGAGSGRRRGPASRLRLPAAAEGAVELHERAHLLAAHLGELQLLVEELLVGVQDLEVAREPRVVARARAGRPRSRRASTPSSSSRRASPSFLTVTIAFATSR